MKVLYANLDHGIRLIYNDELNERRFIVNGYPNRRMRFDTLTEAIHQVVDDIIDDLADVFKMNEVPDEMMAARSVIQNSPDIREAVHYYLYMTIAGTMPINFCC